MIAKSKAEMPGNIAASTHLVISRLLCKFTLKPVSNKFLQFSIFSPNETHILDLMLKQLELKIINSLQSKVEELLEKCVFAGNLFLMTVDQTQQNSVPQWSRSWFGSKWRSIDCQIGQKVPKIRRVFENWFWNGMQYCYDQRTGTRSVGPEHLIIRWHILIHSDWKYDRMYF